MGNGFWEQLDDYKTLFGRHEDLFEDFKSTLEDTKDNDVWMRVMEDYINMKKRCFESHNMYIDEMKRLVGDESVTMDQFARECSSANRYNYDLSLVNAVIDNHDEKVDIETLKEVAVEEIGKLIRRPDFVGTYNEDHMLILLPHTEVANASVVIAKVETRFNELIAEKGWNVRFHFCLTNYNHWEELELVLKRLEHGIIKGRRDQSAIVHI